MNSQIKQFNSEELTAIDKADDLKIAPFRLDGITYGTPTTASTFPSVPDSWLR